MTGALVERDESQQAAPRRVSLDGESAVLLREIVQRIERWEARQGEAREAIRQLYRQAEDAGLSTKTIRKIVRECKPNAPIARAVPALSLITKQ